MNELKPVTREDVDRLMKAIGGHVIETPKSKRGPFNNAVDFFIEDEDPTRTFFCDGYHSDRPLFDHLVARALWENGGWTAVPFGSSIMLVRIQFGQVNFYDKGRAGDYTTERKAGNTYESPLAALEHIVGGK